MGILDIAVNNAQVVQPRGLLLQFRPVTARERNMVQTSAMLIEGLRRAPGMGVQPEQLPTIKREHRVVKTTHLLILIKHRLRTEQPAIPTRASIQVGHSHRNMSSRRKHRHSSPLN